MERRKDKFLLFIKGVIVGIASIVKGVSAGTLALSLGIFEIIIESVAKLFKDFRKYGSILLIFAIGVTVGAISGTELVAYLMKNYQMQTTFLFIGLIIGGLSLVTRKIKGHFSFSDLIVFLIAFAIVILLTFFVPTRTIIFDNMTILNYIELLFVGFVTVAAVIAPGINGVLILMLLGYYDIIYKAITNIFNFDLLFSNLKVLIPFILGVLIGIMLVSKLIMYMIEKHEVKTYCVIAGLIFASVIVIFIHFTGFKLNFTNIFTSILTFLWGYLLVQNLEKE